MWKICLKNKNKLYYKKYIKHKLTNGKYESNNCPVYIHVSKSDHRLVPIKPILVESLDYAFQFDLTYLNKDLSPNFGYLYILSIMDVFSRKNMIYRLNTKQSEPILNLIIELC